MSSEYIYVNVGSVGWTRLIELCSLYHRMIESTPIFLRLSLIWFQCEYSELDIILYLLSSASRSSCVHSSVAFCFQGERLFISRFTEGKKESKQEEDAASRYEKQTAVISHRGLLSCYRTAGSPMLLSALGEGSPLYENCYHIYNILCKWCDHTYILVSYQITVDIHYAYNIDTLHMNVNTDWLYMERMNECMVYFALHYNEHIMTICVNTQLTKHYTYLDQSISYNSTHTLNQKKE